MIPIQGPSQIINFDETLKVFRNGETIFVQGKPIHRDLIQFEIICNVQPINGRELLLVPEGDRHKEQYWVYGNNLQRALLVSDRVQRIDIQGLGDKVNFEVQSLENWGSYQRARVMRIDVGPEATP